MAPVGGRDGERFDNEPSSKAVGPVVEVCRMHIVWLLSLHNTSNNQPTRLAWYRAHVDHKHRSSCLCFLRLIEQVSFPRAKYIRNRLVCKAQILFNWHRVLDLEEHDGQRNYQAAC